jgi:hypothetical protein
MLALPTSPAPSVEVALDALAGRTTGRIGINFLMPFLDPDCVKVAGGRAHVVEFLYGEPDADLVELVYAGHSVDGVHGIQPAAKIVDELLAFVN